MIKIFGAVLLVLGFCGLSFEKVKEEKEQLKRLTELKGFITYLLREIEYSHIPIPDICEEYFGRSEGILKEFLEKVCACFGKKEGKSFDVIWEEECSTGYVGKKEEKEILRRLNKSFGFCNTGMQISAIEQNLDEVEKIILHKEKKFQDNRKLILYFGVMSGLLLSIILL